ncbi:MAG: rhomboid family intramembrane serine protease [Ktedonobacterales bacterium]|nr:rhomboid family intramembrane serine protease [Ktedonobacterales bacterium]
MIPITDDPGPRRTFPFVNYALILINVGVFVFELVKGTAFTDCFTAAYSLVPGAIVQGHTVATGCAIAEPMPVYLTLFTAMFLHAGFLHIGGNMLYLWVFGDNVEDRLGHFWYLIFYLFCGLVASGVQIAATYFTKEDPFVLNLGASGAIAGVLGAYLVFYPGSKVRTIVFIGIFITFLRLAAFIVIGFFILLQVVEAFILVQNSLNGQIQNGGVAFFAHIGGFFAGLVIAFLVKIFGKPPRQFQATYPNWPTHPNLRQGAA